MSGVLAAGEKVQLPGEQERHLFRLNGATVDGFYVGGEAFRESQRDDDAAMATLHIIQGSTRLTISTAGAPGTPVEWADRD